MLELLTQAQFLSKKGEKFDTCYNPRGRNAILISDTHAVNCSFVGKKGLAAREVCLMRLFWTPLELTAAPVAPASLGTPTPASRTSTALGAARGTFSKAKRMALQESSCAAGRSAQSPAGCKAGAELVPTRTAHRHESRRRQVSAGAKRRADPKHPQNSPARTHLSLQVSDLLLELLDHSIFGLNHRFGVLELKKRMFAAAKSPFHVRLG